MRTLYLSIVALTAFAAPVAAQALPSCPAGAGVKDVSYAQAPDLLKQVFSKNRKFSMPGQAFDAANPDAQRLISVKNRNNRWIVVYEQGGGDSAAHIVRYDITPTSISVGPDLGTSEAQYCETEARLLGVPAPVAAAPTPSAQPAAERSTPP